MNWIIGAAVLNTLWTLWCVQFLPPRVATHFGLRGQADGWMSRKGYAWFSILFPLALSAFIVYMGGIGKSLSELTTAMEHLAAGLILFFSALSWCMVRSNKRNPPRIDYLSLFLSIGALLVYTTYWVGGLPKESGKANHASPASNSAQK
jgi:hypothetical protein